MKRIFAVILIFSFTALFSLPTFAQQSSEFYLKKGISLISKKQYQEAYEEFDKAYKLDSKDANILAFRGQALHYLKRYSEAIENYNAALQIQPDYAEVFHLRGLARYEMKDATGACEDWEQANKLGYDMVIDLIIEYCMKNKTEK